MKVLGSSSEGSGTEQRSWIAHGGLVASGPPHVVGSAATDPLKGDTVAVGTDTWQCPTCHRTVARRLKTCPRCAAVAASGGPAPSPGGAHVRLVSLQQVAG